MKITVFEITLLKKALKEITGKTEGDALVKFLSACQNEQVQKEIRKEIEYLNHTYSIDDSRTAPLR